MKELETSRGVILCCDVLEGLAQIEDNSIDAIVTDPPYLIGFMSRIWDKGGISYNVNVWKEALRVLKPGGWLLAFGGTRTYHRLACAIEDAGFEVRDCLMWLYGQGFPKSLDVSKAIDKAAGAEREVVGRYIHPRSIEQGRAIDKSWGKESLDNTLEGYVTQGDDKRTLAERLQLTAPATDAARQWKGFGTALKPAWEPIVLARKPLSEPTIAANVLRWGTGALNIDACRIRTKENLDGGAYAKTGTPRDDGWGMQRAQAGEYEQPAGRWPANLMLECTCERTQEGEIQGTKPHPVVSHQEKYPGYGSITRKQGEVVNYGDADGKEPVHIHTNPECPAAMLDAQSGERTSGYMKPGQQRKASLGAGGYHGNMPDEATGQGTYGDSGGASRYFYCAKASRAEREAGLEDLPSVNSAENLGREEGSAGLNSPRAGAGRTRKEIRNPHPTVKPIALMRYLVRLVTPPEGLVLDLFCGSGSTLAAAVLEGFEYIGIDLDEGYCNIAAHRVQYWERMP
jgi:site-specific DNA-methyltransferase (adenine-specific)